MTEKEMNIFINFQNTWGPKSEEEITELMQCNKTGGRKTKKRTKIKSNMNLEEELEAVSTKNLNRVACSLKHLPVSWKTVIIFVNQPYIEGDGSLSSSCEIILPYYVQALQLECTRILSTSKNYAKLFKGI